MIIIIFMFIIIIIMSSVFFFFAFFIYMHTRQHQTKRRTVAKSTLCTFTSQHEDREREAMLSVFLSFLQWLLLKPMESMHTAFFSLTVFFSLFAQSNFCSCSEYFCFFFRFLFLLCFRTKLPISVTNFPVILSSLCVTLQYGMVSYPHFLCAHIRCPFL